LPIFSIALMLVHQKMFTPPPQDEQQKSQQTIMKYMMIFFGVMFHKIAAGLCIYFIASSIWGLAERQLLPKKKTDTGDKAPTAPLAAASSNGARSADARRKAKRKGRK
jgi:YidC/Oxa1 family membrane protein insertase